MSPAPSAETAASPRTPRLTRLSALVLLLALAFLPVTAQAQLGGLTKKAKAKVTGEKSEAPAADQPARPAAPTLTPGVVDHFIAGLKLERQTLDKARADIKEGEQKAQGASAARSQRWLDSHQKYAECLSGKAQDDPRMAQYDSLLEAASNAEDAGKKKEAETLNARAEKLSDQMQARADSACAAHKPNDKDLSPGENESQPDSREIMREAIDTASVRGARGAGMTVQEYALVKETITGHLRDPKKAGLSKSEAAAVDARRDELETLLKAVGA